MCFRPPGATTSLTPGEEVLGPVAVHYGVRDTVEVVEHRHGNGQLGGEGQIGVEESRQVSEEGGGPV